MLRYTRTTVIVIICSCFDGLYSPMSREITVLRHGPWLWQWRLWARINTVSRVFHSTAGAGISRGVPGHMVVYVILLSIKEWYAEHTWMHVLHFAVVSSGTEQSSSSSLSSSASVQGWQSLWPSARVQPISQTTPDREASRGCWLSSLGVKVAHSVHGLLACQLTLDVLAAYHLFFRRSFTTLVSFSRKFQHWNFVSRLTVDAVLPLCVNDEHCSHTHYVSWTTYRFFWHPYTCFIAV